MLCRRPLTDYRHLGALLAALAAMTACTIPGGMPQHRTQRAIQQVEPKADGSTIVAQGPRITPLSQAALVVENPRGSIHVRVDPTVARPTVRWRITKPRSLSPDERRELVDLLALRARVQVEEDRLTLRVDGNFDLLPTDVHILLDIRMASCGTVMIRNAGGEVELVGVGGQIAIASGGDLGAGGNVRIRTEQPVHGPVHISTTGGDVTFFMSSEASGRFELVSERGTVEMFAGAGSLRDARPQPRRWTGVVNNGDHDMILRSADGHVMVRIADYTWELPGPFDWNTHGGRSRF